MQFATGIDVEFVVGQEDTCANLVFVDSALESLQQKVRYQEYERQVGKKKNKMKISYPVGDFVIRVKNASLARQKEVLVAKTGLIKSVADCLKRAGYLDEIKEEDGKLKLRISYRSKEPVLTDAKLISKPGLRIYMNVDEILSKKGPWLYIVSTPKGVITSKEVKKMRIGGEVIAEIL